MRIFIGIDFGIRQKEAIRRVQDSLRKAAEGRFTRTDNIHLTLNFLGEVDKERLQQVFSVVDEAASVTKAFSLRLGKLGYFPSGRKKIIWLGIEECRGLQNLYITLSDALEKIGFEKEGRDYSPHLTLVREARILRQFEDADMSPLDGNETQEVSEVTVFESTSRRGVLEYLPLHSARLI
ncbi:RNA 2',3'-cyclic phosphodiesterase [Youngiibacter fragilis]|jgi:2'-5' RNA ligase|uniref:RNA 2',3'-cyclic phosphodiesterase n=1 Tax=Youngiibacter fragilis 232.1 TaxID=994573 RepID=V7I6P8_9CLOT|nr:RNA 2',3'-cyclic phosphodiesterase [Youngiibacter fragilis]ETA81900.1 2'-5' RNA ligase [Youngiibacter fragilis 232.1]